MMSPSANWNKTMTLVFVELCVREVELDNRPSTYFNKKGWANLVTSFKDRTGVPLERVQLKNKCDALKKDWKLWKDLLKGCTGISWNNIKRTVDASDEWWEEKLEIYPAAKKFIYNGIEPAMEEKMDYLFGGVVATGEHAWAPSMDRTQFTKSSRNRAMEDDLGSHPDGSPVGSDNDGLSRPTHAMRKKATSAKAAFNNTMKRIADAVEGRSTARPSCSRSVNEPTSVYKVINLLTNEPGLREDSELYFFAMRYLESDVLREIFLLMPPEDRVGFIKSAYNAKK